MTFEDFLKERTSRMPKSVVLTDEAIEDMRAAFKAGATEQKLKDLNYKSTMEFYDNLLGHLSEEEPDEMPYSRNLLRENRKLKVVIKKLLELL